MLTGITLENFKAFKEPQFIPIKPITLVFGPNSAGKSSIMHALAFLKHVDATNGHCDPDSVEFGWEKIRLGSWQNLVHGHDALAVMKITLHWEEKALKWEFRKGADGPYVDSFEIAENGKPVARGKNQRTNGIRWAVELHSSHSSWNEFKEEIWELIEENEYDPDGDYIHSDEGDLGIVEVQGLRLQVVDPAAEAWLKEQPNKRTRSKKEIFTQYFNAWLGDDWRAMPQDTISGGDSMCGLFPGVGKDSSEREEVLNRIFNLPRLASQYEEEDGDAF